MDAIRRYPFLAVAIPPIHRSIALLSLIVGIVLTAPGEPANAQRGLGARLRLRRLALEWQKRHPWTRFANGSWRKSLTTMETLKNGKWTVGKEELTTTLESVSRFSYRLRIQRVLTINGKRVSKKVQFKTHGIFDNNVMKLPEISTLDNKNLRVDNKRISSFGQRVLIKNNDGSTVKKFYWNDSVTPFPLRVETEQTSNKDSKVKLTQLREVMALQMPCTVNSKIISSVVVRTKEESHDNGKTITATSLEHLSRDVPGGTVALSLKLSKEDGKVYHRRTVKLLSYDGRRRVRRKMRNRK